MQRQVLEHRADYDEEPYWADNAFGGIHLSNHSTYPYDFVGTLDKLIRFLPRPADYLFVYMLSFYLLLLYSHQPNRNCRGYCFWVFDLFTHYLRGRAQHQSTCHWLYAFGCIGDGACVFHQTIPWLFHTHTGDGLANPCQSLSNDLLPLDTCGFNGTGIYDRIVAKAKISITDQIIISDDFCILIGT